MNDDPYQDGFDQGWEEAVGSDLSVCPYYQRAFGGDPHGICDRGCSSEPECQTCEPSEGWRTARLYQSADQARRVLLAKVSEVVAEVRGAAVGIVPAPSVADACVLIEHGIAEFVAAEIKGREPF